MKTQYEHPTLGTYRIGDTVEFIADGWWDLQYGQRGTIDGFDETSVPSRPILVAFDSSGRRIACAAKDLDVVRGIVSP